MSAHEDLEKLDRDLEAAERDYQFKQRDLISALTYQSEHARRMVRRQMNIKVFSSKLDKISCATKIEVFKTDVEQFDLLDQKIDKLSGEVDIAYDDFKKAIEALESYHENKIP